MEVPVFFKTSANTTPRQSFLLEGLNRFSLDKYPSFWEKLSNFVLNEHWQTRQLAILGRHTSTFLEPRKISHFSAIFVVFNLPDFNMIGFRVTVDALGSESN